MQIRNLKTLLSILQPKDQVVFGLSYLYHRCRSLITKEDTTTPFLQEEYRKQSEALRLLELGDQDELPPSFYS